MGRDRANIQVFQKVILFREEGNPDIYFIVRVSSVRIVEIVY